MSGKSSPTPEEGSLEQTVYFIAEIVQVSAFCKQKITMQDFGK
jgi:hypothetical protein